MWTFSLTLKCYSSVKPPVSSLTPAFHHGPSLLLHLENSYDVTFKSCNIMNRAGVTQAGQTEQVWELRLLGPQIHYTLPVGLLTKTRV